MDETKTATLLITSFSNGDPAIATFGVTGELDKTVQIPEDLLPLIELLVYGIVEAYTDPTQKVRTSPVTEDIPW